MKLARVWALFSLAHLSFASFNSSLSNETVLTSDLVRVNQQREEIQDDGCENSPYCTIINGQPVWGNECGVPKPSQEEYEKHKTEDVEWLRAHLQNFKRLKKKWYGGLGADEQTFPSYLVKRYAPNISPHSVTCDGLGKCAGLSCEDLGEKISPDDKRRMLLFFEFLSIIDHAHDIMSEATQSFFMTMSLEIKSFLKQFSYADELQDAAIKKKEKREMILNIITGSIIIAGALISAAGSALSTITLGADGLIKGLTKAAKISENASKWADRGVRGVTRLGKIPGAINGVFSGSFIGVTNLAKEYSKIKHGDDLKGFDKMLDLYRDTLALIAQQANDQIIRGMSELIQGKRTQLGQNVVDLYDSGFFSESSVGLREVLSTLMRMYYYAIAIDSSWKSEGTYIVESLVPSHSTCLNNTRGPAKSRVCLKERPNHSYWVQSMTFYKDRKIRNPPGTELLLQEGGYYGLTLEDAVRSCLWKDEIWRPQLREVGDPDYSTVMREASGFLARDKRRDNLGGVIELPSDTTDMTYLLPTNASLAKGTKLLDKYGFVPGAFTFSICRTWNGEAISFIDSTDNANAPCLCDAVDPKLASPWSAPSNWTMAYTDRFVNESGLYNFQKYGDMCIKEHDCEKKGKWATRLQLPKEDKVAKGMENAWGACEAKGHGSHPARREQASSIPRVEPRRSKSIVSQTRLEGGVTTASPRMVTITFSGPMTMVPSNTVTMALPTVLRHTPAYTVEVDESVVQTGLCQSIHGKYPSMIGPLGVPPARTPALCLS